ncbi:MAG: T9SS type A sorting domain-containing protein [Ignavibacteriales bacterium]|nr:T9SS type A sorting domain-containing protein [Ignavibacteriales bacterium]
MIKAIRFAVCAALACLVLTSSTSAQTLVREAISPYSKGKTTFLNKADSGRNFISTGLRVVGKSMMTYLAVDTTGVGAAAKTFAWTLKSVPSGSTAALYDGGTKIKAKFIPDVVGQYIISVTTKNAKLSDTTLADTIWASTYVGNPVEGTATCLCHPANVTSWAKTAHANIFKEGVTGNLENDPAVQGGKGAYAASCIKCHTTGWENLANNGNFGYLAHNTNWTSGGVTSTWDSTWWRGLTLASGDYWVPKDTMNIWNGLPAAMKPVATISCEQCHGPASDHKTTMSKTKIGVSLDAGVCNQCHAASLSKHRIGIDWAASLHATPFVENQTGCFPCHSGTAFVKFVNNPAAPGYDAANEKSQKGCPVCHDPHGNDNTADLRVVKVINDTLMGGFKVTSGGLGQLCMNCHKGRSSVATKVTNTAPSYGYSARYYNHNSPQADMFWGQNGYDFGQTITKVSAHQVVPNSCVTCHMPATKTNNMIVNHAMSMDTAGVAGCTTCHAGATTIAGIKASSDYDGDGTVEGFQAEIDGLMAKLKGYLPIDPATGDVAQGPLLTAADSLKWRGKKNIVAGIWDYNFVVKDLSHGVHNPKYSVGMLQAAIKAITGVSRITGDVAPATFELTQNYPNPFNPSTQIGFALPKASNVRVNIYDITGKLVRSLVDESMAAGKYTATWDGMNHAGQQVTSGVYIYRIEAGSFSATKKMLMLK